MTWKNLDSNKILDIDFFLIQAHRPLEFSILEGHGSQIRMLGVEEVKELRSQMVWTLTCGHWRQMI